MHLVVARYNENINWVHNLNTSFTVYNKGEDDLKGYNDIKVQNQGRESETYLRYILSNYNNLPEQVCFLQGDPFYHCPDFLKKFKQYDFSPLFFFGREIDNDDENGFPNHPGLIIKYIAKELGIYTGKPKYYFVPGAQFVANRQTIRSRSLDWWIDAYRVHTKYDQSPWVFERLWSDIFLV